jgi:uncharacterized RDD family membrane protein YckC
VSREAVNAVPLDARPFQGKRAGIVSRVLANSIDFLLVMAALAATYVGAQAVSFLANPSRWSARSPNFGIALLLGGGYLFVYFAVSWATNGRTYGNHVMGLRVVNFRGERMHWVGSILRSAFCVAFPIGLFWAIISPADRSVQDAVLRTSVLYDWSIGGVTPNE